jgi:hypothetical protein
MLQVKHQFQSFEEYLSYDDGTEKLYELFNGELISALKEQQEELIKIQSKIELLQSQKKEIEYKLDLETSKNSKK